MRKLRTGKHERRAVGYIPNPRMRVTPLAQTCCVPCGRSGYLASLLFWKGGSEVILGTVGVGCARCEGKEKMTVVIS